MRMQLSRQACWRLVTMLAAVAFIGGLQPSVPAEAQTIASTQTLKTGPARVRTLEQMQAPAVVRRAVPSTVVPFRTDLTDAAYKGAKEASAAARAPRGHKPGAARTTSSLAPPSVIFADFDGVSTDEQPVQLLPPDTHGAAGVTQYVEITNSQIDIYERDDPSIRTSITLADFMGYFATTVFDPRVIYDPIWNRWVVSAEAFPESPTVQIQFLAISESWDATGPYFVYGINVTTVAGQFWDYPMLGFDQDAIIVSANVFGPGGFVHARVFAVAKARLYNGLDFEVPVFTGLLGTPQPPMVLDQSNKTFLLAARPGPTTITKYTMTNTAHPASTTLAASPITVPAFAIPPDAPQPDTAKLLDTLDARFVNASTQNGNFLWNAHSINLFGFAAPRFYQINTLTNAVVQSGSFSASGTSHDWNASIAANTSNDVFVTWSSTDPPAGINAQVRFSGRKAGDPAGVIPAGTVLFTSPTFLDAQAGTVQRWGDYSAVTLDPLAAGRAWLVNEKINDTTIWGSRIAHIGFVGSQPTAPKPATTTRGPRR